MLYNKITTMYRCLYCMKQFSTKQYTEMHSKKCKKKPDSVRVFTPLDYGKYHLEYREDDYINITSIVENNKKVYNEWVSSEKTQTRIKDKSKSTGIPLCDIIKDEKGETWIHESLSIHFCNLLSNEFSVKIDNWISTIYPERTFLLREEKKEVNNGQLSIGDYRLIYRQEDGYIDVTNLCKSSGKSYNHWNRLEKNQAYLSVLSRSAGIPADLLIHSVAGGKNEDRKTWVHPKVAINIAQWISPEFDVQVSNWVFELMTTGKVELGKEKPDEEVFKQYKEKINTLATQNRSLATEIETTKEQYNTLLAKHVSTSKTHRYVKFKDTDPCFYIIESGVPCDDCGNTNLQYKFGIAGIDTDQKNTIDDRLRSHRTLWPMLKVKFLLFMKDVVVIEKNFKMMFEKEINPNGHEIIIGVTLEDIVVRLQKLFDLLCVKNYHIMAEDKLKEYNDYTATTLKLL